MSENLPATIKAVLRTDFVSFATKCFYTLNPSLDFVPNWYIEHLAYELLACFAGERKRMIIAAPPRHGKSTLASVVFPAWCLGHDPSMRIIGASYGQEVAARFQIDFRKIVESDWYGEVFPQFQINSAKCTEREVQTEAGGFRYATAFGGPLTAIGGDLIILDDVIKAADVTYEVKRQNVMNWLKDTVFSRLDNKSKGSIIVVGQRLHLQDPIGQLLATGGWHPVVLPAIAEETKIYKLARVNGYVEFTRKIGDLLDPIREPLAVLDQLKLDMGTANFHAQYQQRPEYTADSLILWEWFPTYKAVPKFDYLFLSVDPAIATTSTADWSVCMVIGVLGKTNYILHVERKHLGFTALALRLDQLATKYVADAILIERSGIGISLIKYLEDQKKHRILAHKPKVGKEDRLVSVLPQIEQGQVLMPSEANWLDILRHELVGFPNSTHDDQVDALSQFLIYRGRCINGLNRKKIHQTGAPPKYGSNTGSVNVYGLGGPRTFYDRMGGSFLF
jgi:predicted phage terminase large subunit-like protein